MRMYMYAYVSECVFMERVRGNLVLIVCKGSYGSLLIGIVIVT